MPDLQTEIERLFALGASAANDPVARPLFAEFIALLNNGKVRAAEKVGDRWRANEWVKQGILLGFRLGKIVEFGNGFVDKDTFPPQVFPAARGIRVAPGGSSVRAGAYLAPGVICMPPIFVNTGAFVDEDTMIDSHALVGSCAQIGKRVHLSAGAQIGGVLEPVNATPVIIEDDVLVGGNCGVYEGTQVRTGAVLAAGTILTRSTPLYDAAHGVVYRAAADNPLVVPADAVVVPGSRPFAKGNAEWQLSVYCPVIVKYRDEKTAQSCKLEDSLRVDHKS